MKHLWILPFIGLLSACTALGPDFETPAAPVAADWREADTLEAGPAAGELADWWRVFDDETLNTLIDAALSQNLTLRIAGVRIFEARAQLGIAAGNRYPQQQRIGGSISQVELSEKSPNANPLLDTSFRDSSIGFDAAWELDIWGRFRRGIEAADANLLAEVAGYDDALVSLTAEVAKTYVAIRTLEARLAIARENVAIQERSLKIASVRFENGVSTELDVEQARTLLANTRASIPELRIGLRQAQNALSILLGVPPGALPALAADVGKIPPAPEGVAIGMPADLLRRRPDIRRAELQAAAQSALIGLARADLYPQFSLTGSVGLRASDTGVSDLGDLFDGDSLQAGVGPSFSWNILNYGRLRNAVRVEDARFQQASINYRNTVLSAAREVEDAVVAFVRGQERVTLLQTSVEAARRAVDLALIQYRDGSVDYTRVLNSQTFLVAQQDALTAASGQVIRDLIATYKALGGGWQLRPASGVLPDELRQEMERRTDWGEMLSTGEPTAGSGAWRKPDW